MVILLSICQAVVAADQPEKDGEKPAALTSKWTVLWDARRAPSQPTLLEGDSPLEALIDFELTGVPTADRFLLRSVVSNGQWGSKNKLLCRMNGKDSALKLANGDQFEMEGVFQADGLGGWFILLGWNQGHGYGLYNVTLKESVSVWYLTEFRDSTALEQTHRGVGRFAWKGPLPLKLRVVDRKLWLRVGRKTIVTNVELPNYQPGDIILGTYDTPYGPNPVTIRSLRIRAK